MERNYIQKLIELFFKNDHSPEICQRFQWWLLDETAQTEKESAMQRLWETEVVHADSSMLQTLEALQKRITKAETSSISIWRRYLGRIAAILLLPLLGAFGCFYYLTRIHPVVDEPSLTQCIVPYGEYKEIELPDGSKAWLNSGSFLIYEKEFKGHTRTLFLSGEANFKVAKNPEKPFIVKTKYIQAEALGTIFNVRSYPDAEQTIATLEEGKICVKSLTDSLLADVVLSPNEQVIYNHLLGTYSFRQVDAAKNAQWIQGYLIFQGATFREIMQTLERRFSISINYEEEKYKGRTFTIKFTPEEDVFSVFELLRKMIGLEYKIRNNTVVIYN